MTSIAEDSVMVKDFMTVFWKVINGAHQAAPIVPIPSHILVSTLFVDIPDSRALFANFDIVGLALSEQVIPHGDDIPVNGSDWPLNALIMGDGSVFESRERHETR